VFHGGPAPGWVSVLTAAKEWGIPPWEISPTVPKVLWWQRWAYWQEQVNKKRTFDDG